MTGVTEEHVIVGNVRGVWGVRGHIKIEVLTDTLDRFSVGSVVYLDGTPCCIGGVRSHGRGLVVKLDSINTRSEAEAIQNCQLTVPTNLVPHLPEGSYYHFQLIDMDVWSEVGDYIGFIREIIRTGANDVYVVNRGDKKDILVPALKDTIIKVILKRNKMIVKLPTGLYVGD